ncbi:MAG: hypothetical protein HY885_02465 [Deltaproteobacteria bacterium]|nr:hypothetical protein [Deltaproteobacteria bacterium]
MNALKILYVTSLLFLFTSVVSAEEKFDFGEQWTKAAVSEKMFFMQGYQTGYIVGAMNATKHFMPTKSEEEKEAAFKKASMIYNERRFGNDMIVNIVLMMDKLYADPANRYIDKGFIMELAIDKLRGKSIEEDLALHRKAAEEEETKPAK